MATGQRDRLGVGSKELGERGELGGQAGGFGDDGHGVSSRMGTQAACSCGSVAADLPVAEECRAENPIGND